jgi:gluconolactonase
MGTVMRDERLARVLEPDAALEPLGTGFRFAEGPLWVPDGDYLLFSDVPASKRFRWSEATGVLETAGETFLGNGMTIDLDGRLVVCEGETGCVVRMSPLGDGSGREVLVGTYRGQRLNSPNDVVIRSDGTLYFTDSWWPNRLGRQIVRELDFQGVFRWAGGEPEVLIDDMGFPNGLCLSPDEGVLYVSDSVPGRIRAFDVAADGSLSNDRVFADGLVDRTGHVDGMKCDEQGNVWVTGPGGIWILDPSGTALGVVETPARTGNLHWGGPDWSWLFVACSSTLFRLRTRTQGRAEPFMQRAAR